MKNLSLALLGIFCFTLFSCLEDKSEISYYSQDEIKVLNASLNLPEKPFDYTINLPDHLNSFSGVNSFAGDPSSIQRINDNHMITLGRVLFYDKNLSHNSTVSCASCHDQSLAFADAKALSEGFEGELTKRNSLALGATPGFETSYGSGESFGAPTAGFSWDESIADIQGQSKAAFLSEVEMGMTMSEVVKRVRDQDYYQVLFDKGFSDRGFSGGKINESNVLIALERFVNSIAAVNSKFDRGIIENQNNPFEDFSNFSAQENLGKDLFLSNCASCHGESQSIVVKPTANNGIDLRTADDLGLGGVTKEERDMGVFKVPLLRNVALTGPFMHDGRFETLEEVVDHYSSEILDHPNLSRELKTPHGESLKMNFTDTEKTALVAFLKTLTDEEMIAEPKFSDPYKS